jgi:glucose-1-phosphate thymidylyltransferase
MKIIIPLTQKNTSLSKLASDRPEPLLSLAGNTILGHLLILLQPITTDEVIIATGEHEETIKNWLTENFPDLNIRFVNIETGGRSKSILACQDCFGDEEVLIVSGRSLSEADYVNIPEPEADIVVMSRPEEPEADANVWWFRNGSSLVEAIQATTNYNDAIKHLRNEGAVIMRKPVKQWLDARTPDTLLEANKRLLGLGRGTTPNAIDRSYAEDFTAMPPVYIAEDAYIESGVIGPYAHIGSGVTIKNAIISNSIIEDNAHIENTILKGSFVGESTKITGRTQKLFIGDNSTVQLT